MYDAGQEVIDEKKKIFFLRCAIEKWTFQVSGLDAITEHNL